MNFIVSYIARKKWQKSNKDQCTHIWHVKGQLSLPVPGRVSGDAPVHACRMVELQRGASSARRPGAPPLLAARRALGLQRVPAGAAAIPLRALLRLRRVRQRAGQPGAMAAAAVGARGAGRWLAALCSRGASGAAMVSAARAGHRAFLRLGGGGCARRPAAPTP